MIFDSDGDKQIEKYNAAGVLQHAYTVDTTSRGSDWIELSSDQHTIFYTSEGTTIKRFDVSANGGLGHQLSDFAVGLAGFATCEVALVPRRREVDRASDIASESLTEASIRTSAAARAARSPSAPGAAGRAPRRRRSCAVPSTVPGRWRR